MQFIPLWTSMLHSRKVASLSGDDYKVWTMCMLLAQEYDFRTGSLPPISDISYALHMSQKDCLSTLSTLVRGHFLDVQNGTYFVHDWSDWKLGKDPTGAEKKRRYREKKKLLAECANEAIVPGHGGHPQMSTLSTHSSSVIQTQAAACLGVGPDDVRTEAARQDRLASENGTADPPESPPVDLGPTPIRDVLAKLKAKAGAP